MIVNVIRSESLRVKNMGLDYRVSRYPEKYSAHTHTHTHTETQRQRQRELRTQARTRARAHSLNPEP